MNISYKGVIEEVAETLVSASTTFRPDQIQAYRNAIDREENLNAKWVLETILENAEVAAKKRLPLCDDTGIPHVFLDVGNNAGLPPGFFKAVENGVATGLRRLPGRPMAVLGDEADRISQSAGLSQDPADVSLAPIQIRSVPGSLVQLTVLMLGGGPEIRGKTQRIFHKHSIDVAIEEMVQWANEGASLLGCLPCVLAFGVGRTNIEAASLALEAMKDGNFLLQNPLEKRITEAVNKAKIGPLGLGGNNTVLATFLKVGPQRASGVRVVSLRVGCCFDPRRATLTF
ncbi:MAG: fumarate hydratase [Bacillota bacterium]